MATTEGSARAIASAITVSRAETRSSGEGCCGRGGGSAQSRGRQASERSNAISESSVARARTSLSHHFQFAPPGQPEIPLAPGTRGGCRCLLTGPAFRPIVKAPGEAGWRSGKIGSVARFFPATMVTRKWPCRRIKWVWRSFLISRHRRVLSRELFSMRQTWNLRPAGAVDGAWILFTLPTVFLFWLASGQLGVAQAQEPAAKGEPAAAKAEAAGTARRGRRRGRPPSRRRPGRPRHRRRWDQAARAARTCSSGPSGPRARSGSSCSASRSTSRPW